MEENEKPNLSNSSLVDLKAELYRKHAEFRQQKKEGASFVKAKSEQKTKPNLFNNKNKGVLERAKRDYEEKVEEEDVFEKSRKALEAKAQLYEKIASSSDIPEEDGSQVYLVDFQKKVIDQIVKSRDKEQRETASDEDEHRSESVLEAAGPGEEWVDYTDSLGRSRRCMKKDLPKLQEKDRELAKIRGESVHEKNAAPHLMSDDMYREQLRQKWEQEEQAALNNTNIHYANVQFDEIRTHGVGFYQFDKNEETRQKQMENLENLRDQTKDERGRRERLKEKRKAMLDARLAKVKQRRKLKEGASFSNNEEKSEDEIGPKLDEMLSKSRENQEKPQEMIKQLTRDDSWKRDAPTREWDKGKEKNPFFSHESYMSARRSERPSEFAPPPAYYDTKSSPNSDRTTPAASACVQQSGHDDTSTENQSTTAVYNKNQMNYNISTSSSKSDEVDVSTIPLPKHSHNISEMRVIPDPFLSQGHCLETQTTALDANSSRVHSQYSAQSVWGQNPAQYSSTSGPAFVPLPDTSMPPPYFFPQGVPTVISNNSTPVHPSWTLAAVNADAQDVKLCKTSSAPLPVPKLEILDTRLVQNVDADIPRDVQGVPEGMSQVYEPGSFTAELRARQQATEDIATASRERSEFKSGPIMYSQIPEDRVESSEPEPLKVSGVQSRSETEDEVNTFLKSLREST